LGSIVARPRPAQVRLSRIDRCVVRIRDRWIFSGLPSSPVTPWRSIQRWTAIRLADPPFAEISVPPGFRSRSHRSRRCPGPA